MHSSGAPTAGAQRPQWSRERTGRECSRQFECGSEQMQFAAKANLRRRKTSVQERSNTQLKDSLSIRPSLPWINNR
jgi:hypothetical protein